MSAPMITWVSINLKSGGTKVIPGDRLLRRHGDLDMRQLRNFPDIIRRSPHPADIILLQEAKWFDVYGDELLFYVERLLAKSIGRYRGFLTRSDRSHHHQVVFLSERLQAVHHWKRLDKDESEGFKGFVEFIVDSDEDYTIWAKSVHLQPRDPAARLADARGMNAIVPDGQRALIAGDFNSITSARTAAEGEPQRDFSKMPPAKRWGKGRFPPTRPDGDTDPETDALDLLIASGWECQAINDGNVTPTIATGVDRGGELIIDRCLTRGGLDTVPGSMWVDGTNDGYSDHCLIGGQLTVVDNPSA